MIDPHAKVSPVGLVGISRARRQTFPRNGLLFYADCAADAGYLISHGQVRCFHLDADGRETTTAILGPGHFVGSDALLGRQVYQEFCEALTDVEAWSLPADELRKSCVMSPLPPGWLITSIGRRLELALALRRGISLLPAAECLDDIQLRLRILSGVDPLNVRQASLASLLQLRPETLARAHQSRRHTERERERGSHQQRLGTGRREFVSEERLDPDLPDGCIGQVVSGCVEVVLLARGSRSLAVEKLGPGDLFGFSSLLGLPRLPLGLTGITPGALAVIGPEQFLRSVASSQGGSGQLVIRLAERLQMLERQLARAASPDVSDRLVDVLREAVSHAADGDRPGYVPADLSHVALARRLGVCRETVTRGLAALVKAGVITRQGRRIVMLSDRATSAAPAQATRNPRPHAGEWKKCRLCGLRTPGTLCPGCAERLERDLERNQNLACPDCGRHRELCAMMPCSTPSTAAIPTREKSAILWVPIKNIDEPATERNSRRTYAERSIRELAVSLRQEGFLQPLCVRRKGARFELVFGVRRFRAALQAGLTEVPCTLREADDDRALLLNAVENLHREQLSNVERVKTIERLATSGLGVREISRRTGFNASTISRWLRINRRQELKKALEEDRIDIARAVILVDAPETCISALLERAMEVSTSELRRQVASAKAGGKPGLDADRRNLTEALRCLRAVRSSANEPLLVQTLLMEIGRISGGPVVGVAKAAQNGTAAHTLTVERRSPRRLLTQGPTG